MATSTQFISHSELLELFHYDPDTGIFTKRATNQRVGSIDGARGYCLINVKGRTCRAHRFAWLYMTGEWPEMLDHINGDRADNRFCNLRLATHVQNSANKRSFRDVPKGVYLEPGRRKWRAFIRGKHIGTYDTVEEAAEAYRTRALEIWGEFASFGTFSPQQKQDRLAKPPKPRKPTPTPGATHD